MGRIVKHCSILMILFLITTYQSQATEESMRTLLEETYRKHISACESGEEAALRETISSFLYATITKNLASLQRDLTPELIKSMVEDTPDISKMKFIKIIENGPTAGLIYVKDSEERDASNKPRVKFSFIKFVNENSVWKVDGMMDAGSPKYNDDGTETEFNMDFLPPELAIDGKAVRTPDSNSM